MRARIFAGVAVGVAGGLAIIALGHIPTSSYDPIADQGPESIQILRMVTATSDDPMLEALGEGSELYHLRVDTKRNLTYEVRFNRAKGLATEPLQLKAPAGPGKFDIWVVLQPLDPKLLWLNISKSLKVSMTIRKQTGEDSYESTSDFKIIDNPLRGNRAARITGSMGWKAHPLIGDLMLHQVGPALGDSDVFARMGLTDPEARKPVECDLVVQEMPTTPEPS